jgi:hypothetical protein
LCRINVGKVSRPIASKKVCSTATFVENVIQNRVLKVRSTVTFASFYQCFGATHLQNAILNRIFYKYCGATHLFYALAPLNRFSTNIAVLRTFFMLWLRNAGLNRFSTNIILNHCRCYFGLSFCQHRFIISRHHFDPICFVFRPVF